MELTHSELEKAPAGKPQVSLVASVDDAVPSSTIAGHLKRINARIEGLAGFEARGITRVLPEERQPPSLAGDLQVAILWLSANLSGE